MPTESTVPHLEENMINSAALILIRFIKTNVENPAAGGGGGAVTKEEKKKKGGQIKVPRGSELMPIFPLPHGIVRST